jgi:hypothetical protein
MYDGGVSYWRAEVPRADAIAMIATVVLWGILLLATAWACTRFELPWLRGVQVWLYPAAWLVGLPLIRCVTRRWIARN